jgi:FtsH-binding integral membrane protein
MMFGMVVMGFGLTCTPLIAAVSAASPSIVPTCLGLTTAIFGGASLVAFNMKKDSMQKYKRVLIGSLLGVIGLDLGGFTA